MDSKPKSFKIEGAAFDRVKALRDNIDRAKDAYEKAHEALWEGIKAEVPEAKDDHVNHTLDAEHEQHGVYFVKEETCGCPVHLVDAGLIPGKPGSSLMDILRGIASKPDKDKLN